MIDFYTISDTSATNSFAETLDLIESIQLPIKLLPLFDNDSNALSIWMTMNSIYIHATQLKHYGVLKLGSDGLVWMLLDRKLLQSSLGLSQKEFNSAMKILTRNQLMKAHSMREGFSYTTLVCLNTNKVIKTLERA